MAQVEVFFDNANKRRGLMFAGIDISKDWFDVAWLVDAGVRCERFDYSDLSIEQLLQRDRKSTRLNSSH